MASRFQFLCLVLLSAAIIIPTQVLASCTGGPPEAPVTMDELMKMITRAKLRLSDFKGKWEAEYKNANLAIIKDGKETTICRDELSKECDASIPAGNDTYIFGDGKIQQTYNHLEGIKTVEESKAKFPKCAKDGIYPVEFILAVPESHTVSYNPFNGDLSYHDVRRPDTTDCVVAFYDWNDKGVGYLKMKQVVTYSGSLEDLLKFGPSCNCGCPPEQCVAETEEEIVTLDFYNEFDLFCKSKSCKGPPAPSFETDLSSVVV